MDQRLAESVVRHWSGGSGVVPRGPKTVLTVTPALPGEVERHTGRRPATVSRCWRIEVGGRFLSSSGVVYPGGVPFPEELHSRTAVVANEVWLYVDEDACVLGAYWWPDAVRRPVASVPREDFPSQDAVPPEDARDRVDVPVPMPDRSPWVPVLAVCLSREEVVVFCTKGPIPEPLNEMVAFEQGGLTVRATAGDSRAEIERFLHSHQPPFRRIGSGSTEGIARDPGRALGPQTWPWPGELRFCAGGVTYQLRGFEPAGVLAEVAETIGA